MTAEHRVQTRNTLGHLEDRTCRIAQPTAFVDEETLEVIDVRLEEVAAGEQGVDLALDLNPFGLAGPACFLTRLLDETFRHLTRRVDRSGRLRFGLGSQFGGLGLGLGDGGVGRALREQQGATDRFGLVDRGRDVGARLRFGCGALGSDVLDRDGHRVRVGRGLGRSERSLVLGGGRQRADGDHRESGHDGQQTTTGHERVLR